SPAVTRHGPRAKVPVFVRSARSGRSLLAQRICLRRRLLGRRELLRAEGRVAEPRSLAGGTVEAERPMHVLRFPAVTALRHESQRLFAHRTSSPRPRTTPAQESSTAAEMW